MDASNGSNDIHDVIPSHQLTQVFCGGSTQCSASVEMRLGTSRRIEVSGCHEWFLLQVRPGLGNDGFDS